MTTYARIVNGLMVERIDPLVIDGREVPLDERFHQSVVEALTPIDPDDPPPTQPPAQPPGVPQEVTMQKARRALHAVGKLADVEAAIDALPEPARTDARIQWEYSATVQRNQPLVLSLGQALGLDLDLLFTEAAAL